jgi:hypothetical protein
MQIRPEMRAAAIRPAPFVWRDPRDIPRRQMLYGGHLFRKFVSCTFAQGGVGKSSLVLAEAIAMAAGRNLLGHKLADGPLRVWIWNGEDPLEELERRVAAICLYYRIGPNDIGDRLYLNSGRDCEIILATTSKSGTTIAHPVISALQAAISAEKIDVVMLDPFVSVHSVSENDNGAIASVCKAISGIADTCDCAFELVHHVRKTGGAEVTVEDGRGAVALLSAARSARVLNVMTKEEGEKAGVEQHRSHFRADNGKANLAPPPDKSEWFRLHPVSLGNGDDRAFDNSDRVAVVTPWTWPDMMQDVHASDIGKVQAVVASGRWRENHQAKDWVGIAIGQALGLNPGVKTDKAKIIHILKTWIGTGMLVVVEGKDEKNNKRSFVEVGTPANE